jgi:hypothetical protein
MLALCFACKKPGIGGDATIKGYVQAEKYNATFTQYIASYPAKDIYIYIVYGEKEAGYNARVKTDYKGEFEFPYLYKGDYTIYTYSRDSTLMDPSGIVPVVKSVEIEKIHEEVILDTLKIFQ